MAERKDTWDKFDIVSKFAVSVAIALIAGLYTYSQNKLEKQRQARSSEVETLSKFMPYLSGSDELAKKAALLAMRRISSTEFMTEVAQLYPSAGAVEALRVVSRLPSATTDERSVASAAIFATVNRGTPPSSFIHELIAWAKTAPDEIFAADGATDSTGVYTKVEKALGPWRGLSHRRAAMLEVMCVLAGFESGWRWDEGADLSNASSFNDPNRAEAGAWQVDADSMNFGPELKSFVMSKLGTLDPVVFQTSMKADHAFAMEFVARLLRRTTRFSGAFSGDRINSWLSRKAVDEFELRISNSENGMN